MMRRWHEDEDGAVAIIVGITMVILVMFAAFVLDIGAVRADVRASQSLADFGSTAAVQVLNEGGTHQDACQEVFQYFLANSEDVSTGTMDCSPFALMDSMGCAAAAATIQGADPSAAFMAEGTAGPYTIRVYMPVPDTHFLMTRHGLVTDPIVDGFDQCDRVGVEIFRDRAHLFAGVGGFNDVRSWADAVALRTQDGKLPEYATLIVLDPHGCRVLEVAGGPGAVVIENYVTATDTFEGFITVDSDGGDGCASTASNYVLKANGSGSRICAGVAEARADAIFTAPNSASRPPCDSTPETLLSIANPLVVANPADLTASPPNIEPTPDRRPRITREPIDHRYNCRSDYYAPGYANSQGRRHYPIDEPGDDDVSSCDDLGTGGGDPDDRRAHVDDLVATYGTMSSAPVGWTTLSGNPQCRVQSADVTYSGNVFVNCPGGFRIDGGRTATFDGGGTVVFRGPVEIRGNLRINPANAADGIVYVQSGDIYTGGSTGTIEVRRSFVYLENGMIDLQIPTVWTAPLARAYNAYDASGTLVSPGNCTYTSGAPNPSCFQNLAFWGNNLGRHDLGGQATLDLEGTFFSPNAGRQTSGPGQGRFVLHGGPGYRLDHAQFFSYQLELNGGSVLTMRPDPDRINPTPLKGGGLIR